MPDPLLATVADLGVLVGETLASNDPKALLYLRSASDIAREYCGQFLSLVEDDVEKVRVVGCYGFVKELPIVEVTKIERPDGVAWIDLSLDDLDVDDETGRLELTTSPTATRWRVTYSHGYATMPQGIATAVLSMAAGVWDVPFGVDNERIGQRSIKYVIHDRGLAAEAQLVLANYRYPGAH